MDGGVAGWMAGWRGEYFNIRTLLPSEMHAHTRTPFFPVGKDLRYKVNRLQFAGNCGEGMGRDTGPRATVNEWPSSETLWLRETYPGLQGPRLWSSLSLSFNAYFLGKNPSTLSHYRSILAKGWKDIYNKIMIQLCSVFLFSFLGEFQVQVKGWASFFSLLLPEYLLLFC